MHFRIISRLLAAAAWLAFVGAQQTFESTDVNGNTVLVSVSSDPVLGTAPVEISTLPVTGTALSTPLATSAAAVTTTAPRVVGQPGATTGDAGPTTYHYTTTDVNGQTTVITTTWTPTYNVGTISTAVASGTIIPYEQYTSVYGGGSGSGSGTTHSGAVRQLATFGACASAVICMFGGITLLL